MQKIIFKKFLKETKETAVVGLMFAAMFMAGWVVMPVSGAEAASRKQKSRISAGYLRDLSIVL